MSVTENILMLERGREELLLANYLDLRPLYINKGRNYIKTFLEAVPELGTCKKISKRFPDDAGLLDMLIQHRIIVPRDPTYNIAPETPQLSFNNIKGMSLYLLLSQSCNMGCVYCLNGTETYQRDKDLMMSKEIAFKSVDRCLDSINPDGWLEVIFFGGEPLLNWPLAKETVLYCEKSLKERHAGKKIKYHLTSNLSILPDDLIEWATKYDFTFLCDVDGPKKIHDRCRPFKDGASSHDIVVKNIDRLNQAGLQVFLRSTVTSLNHDHLPEISRYHKEIGGKTSAFVPLNPFNSDEDILDERLLPLPQKLIEGMTEIYKSRIWNEGEIYPFNTYRSRLMPGARTVQGCGAPHGNTPVVTVNGDVYPCIYLVGINRFYMGNIMDESYPDRTVLQRMYDFLHVDQREDCKECSWRYICSGACPLGRLMLWNNPAASEKVRNYCNEIKCDYTRQIFELLLWERGEQAASTLLGEHNCQGTGCFTDAGIC